MNKEKVMKKNKEDLYNNFLKVGHYSKYLNCIVEEMKSHGLSEDKMVQICSTANARFQCYLNEIYETENIHRI